MNQRSDYTDFRDGQWRVWVGRASWRRSVWPRLRQVVEQQASTGRPRVHRLALVGRGAETQLLLKVYPASEGAGRVKDLFRSSPALRYWRQALALQSCGFLTPTVRAVGEYRSWRRLELAFIVTDAIPARSLSVYLWGDGAQSRPRLAAVEKRACIRELGRQVGRMHALGFVHGDLVLSNVLVQRERERTLYYYIDHDRTRRYARWFPQTVWKRNLIQLNRLLVPGISAQDRLRFFLAYLEGRQRQYGARERRWLHWLGRRTAVRRKETRRPGRETRAPRPRDQLEFRIEER